MVCTDLANTAAPPGSVVAVIHPNVFKRWMARCNAIRVDNENTGQVVAILMEGAAVNNGGISYTPNWHLTAMTDRQKTVVNNFHFKIEATKAASHFWHYKLYYDAVAASFTFVGDVGKVAGRNDAGGGAADNLAKLNANLASVNLASTLHGLDNGMTLAKQVALATELASMVEEGQVFNKGGVWQ